MIDDQARSVSGGLGEYAWTGRERSMGEVLKDIVANVQDMVRGEVRLAKAELREEAGRSASAAKLIGMGGGLALLGAGFLLVALTQLLALIMPDWVASLLVGGILAVVGFVLLGKGRSQFTVPAPHKTIENVKENVQWMKDQTKS